MSNPRPKLILASGSPQRDRLLREAGYTFRIVVPSANAECGVCSKETPGELVARLACQKAADVAGRLWGQSLASPERPSGEPTEVIVACDTICECRGRVLGKPLDARHARQMLEWLRGQEHHVYSGLCLQNRGSQPHVSVARTTLKMDCLEDSQIDEYLDSGQWEQKAGAFGYQDRAGWLHITEGSESNVIGLPLELLATMLSAL